MTSGWQALVSKSGSFRGEERFPLPAYSEYMPPPRIGPKPSGLIEYDSPFDEEDLFGWHITAHELERHIAPGLGIIGRQIVEATVCLATGRGAHRIGRRHISNNPYWPEMLHGRVLQHEAYVFLSPLALAKTQDDKGRVRWTFFGASTEGPARGFWRSFFTAPNVEMPEYDALERIRGILISVYNLSPGALQDLKGAGFRIHPGGHLPDRPEWDEGPLPRWTREYLLDAPDFANCRYLLTFAPFALLPPPIQQAYLSGALNLLPSPVSMAFWGSPLIRALGTSLPFGDQVLLQHAIARHEGRGIRVPQSGWLHHHRVGHTLHDHELGMHHGTFRRTHRWQRVLRHDDDSAHAREDAMHIALFSAHPNDVRLYGKPMARNAQIWSSQFEAVLHGPEAGHAEISAAMSRMKNGGSFGYRLFYPPMRVGNSVVFWHRPVLAYEDRVSRTPQVRDCGVSGYFSSAGLAGETTNRVELWPRHHTDSAIPWRSRAPRSIPVRTPGMSAGANRNLTFEQTATRAFELRYWKTIANLAEGCYLNKNNGDCVRDKITQQRLVHPGCDLDLLADYLLRYYRQLASRFRMQDRVTVGDLPFRWKTDFEFPWMGGWLENQSGRREERNLITVIPGKNSSEAVIMADHYDTAYMEDIYGDRPGVDGDGSRLAAAGADDNHSATAALMLGARIFLDLSRRGLLDCDIWLVHLTGEEFPADCLGSRSMTQKLIEGKLCIRCSRGTMHNLSETKIRGVYVLDMIAHNNDGAPDIFQIAPGTTNESLWLAEQADITTSAWAAGTRAWNQKPRRRQAGRGRRVGDGSEVPPIARHLAPRGEIRLHDNPKSTLYNTDGQIFSDAGLPVVLFMENYDIHRVGYHDSHDTMANIDLDYGAAVAAIAIETVAQTAAGTGNGPSR